MYCVNCGVKLADTESQCPLCKTKVFHPDIVREEVESLYPKNKYPTPKISSRWAQFVVSMACLLVILVVLLSDAQVHRTVTWSGFVIGALFVAYVCVVLPFWFKKPNPVIFTPCGFAAAGLYLLYINLATGGQWFLSFAFPVLGGIGLIVTAVVTLVRYVPNGKLYIFGGASVALGAFMLLMEFLLGYTFDTRFIGWSLYPLISLVLIGCMLIFLAICRPARETMERKFFI